MNTVMTQFKHHTDIVVWKADQADLAGTWTSTTSCTLNSDCCCFCREAARKLLQYRQHSNICVPNSDTILPNLQTRTLNLGCGFCRSRGRRLHDTCMSSSVLSQRLRPRSLLELLQSLQIPQGPLPCHRGRQQVRAYCTIVDATIMTIIIITIIVIFVTVHSHDHRRGSIIIPLNTPAWLCLQGRRATMGCTNALGADV